MFVCNVSNVAVFKNVPAAVGRYFSVRCKIYKHLGITIFIFVCFFYEIGITRKLIGMFRTSNLILPVLMGRNVKTEFIGNFFPLSHPHKSRFAGINLCSKKPLHLTMKNTVVKLKIRIRQCNQKP